MEEKIIKHIKELLDDRKVDFGEFYHKLKDQDLGNWDSINSEDVIKQYVEKQMKEGVHVSHILRAIEENPSKEELYKIWLGNSMETPTPINTKKQLVEALELDLEPSTAKFIDNIMDDITDGSNMEIIRNALENDLYEHITINKPNDKDMVQHVGHSLTLEIDESRNGNLNLVCKDCRVYSAETIVCEFQNNEDQYE